VVTTRTAQAASAAGLGHQAIAQQAFQLTTRGKLPGCAL
jgi:hypothetical protein